MGKAVDCSGSKAEKARSRELEGDGVKIGQRILREQIIKREARSQ
jgi:hypothetical protein